MVDIHCHLLYGVDDGAKTIEESAAMLQEAKNQGISAIILTPHYRHGFFAYPKEEIEEHDKEGRVITLEFEKFYMVTIYTPNAKRELEGSTREGFASLF